MNFFSLTQELAMDLGTANTIVICNGKIVVNEPSVVAIEEKSEKLIAFGAVAKPWVEKTPPGIRTVFPLKDGVIADFKAAEMMIRAFIEKATPPRKIFVPSLKVVVGVPSGSTEVEKRAVVDSMSHAGGREIYLIYEPMAAAIGMDIDVLAPNGNMVVNIGGGTTEIAVISLGGIVLKESIKFAGNRLTTDIVEYMRRQHSLKTDSEIGEKIKIAVGSALENIEDPPENFIVRSANSLTSLPMDVPVSNKETAHCLDRTICNIESAILNALENTAPSLYADIVNNGIYLSGGGALLRGLDKRLSKKFNIAFHVADDPLLAVARGTAIVLKNLAKYINTTILVKSYN